MDAKFLSEQVKNYLFELEKFPAKKYEHLRGEGPIKKLEQKLAKYYNRKYCIAFSSATNACSAVALFLNQSPQIKVGVAPFNYPTSISGLKTYGIELEYLPVKKQSFEIDPSKLPSSFDAFWLCDFAGNPTNLEEIKQVLPNAYAVLDASQSFGATVNGAPSHPLADVVITSFTSGKVLSALEGGAVITDDVGLYEYLLHFWHPERVRYETTHIPDYPHINARLNPLAAVIALSTFEASLKLVREKQKKYTKRLELISRNQNTTFFLPSTNKQSSFHAILAITDCGTSIISDSFTALPETIQSLNGQTQISVLRFIFK